MLSNIMSFDTLATLLPIKCNNYMILHGNLNIKEEQIQKH